jgi:hypothetical protein
MTEEEKTIARAIFDWLLTTDGAPYSFNEDEADLSVSVDGFLDCKILAKFISARLHAS